MMPRKGDRLYPWEKARMTARRWGVSILTHKDFDFVWILLGDYRSVEDFYGTYPYVQETPIRISISKDVARRLLEKLQRAKEEGYL